MSAYRNRDDFGPITRNRSSSANEASKPIVMLHRRPTQLGGKPSNFSPSNGSNGGKLYFAFLFRFLVSLTFCCVCIFLLLWANWVIIQCVFIIFTFFLLIMENSLNNLIGF